MDIDLLAKMVKEVVMDNDSVTLPGVGCFVTEMVPATFADRGYTILPPYRRLSFTPKQGDDKLLVELYARSNGISEADATRILTDFLSEMKEVLKEKKTIIMPGLGRLRATRENHFFFIADEDLDIYPSGFGLKPISLKTHEETKEEVEEAVANLAGMLEEPEPEPEVIEEAEESSFVAEEEADAPQEDSPALPEESESEPEPEVTEEAEESSFVAEEEADAPQEDSPALPDESEPESEPEPEVPRAKSKFWRVLGIVLAVVAGVALLAVLVLVLLGHVAPDWLDELLYSPEELEILRK